MHQKMYISKIYEKFIVFIDMQNFKVVHPTAKCHTDFPLEAAQTIRGQ